MSERKQRSRICEANDRVMMPTRGLCHPLTGQSAMKFGLLHWSLEYVANLFSTDYQAIGIGMSRRKLLEFEGSSQDIGPGMNGTFLIPSLLTHWLQKIKRYRPSVKSITSNISVVETNQSQSQHRNLHLGRQFSNQNHRRVLNLDQYQESTKWYEVCTRKSTGWRQN